MNDMNHAPRQRPPQRKGVVIVLIALGVVVVLGVIVFLVFSTGSSEPPTSVEGNIVRYTGDSYHPGNIQIKAGETVTWKNDSGSAITVDSNPHPIHTSYRPLNLGRIEPGAEQQLTFTEAGAYNYHNHLSPTKRGTVTVQ